MKISKVLSAVCCMIACAASSEPADIIVYSQQVDTLTGSSGFFSDAAPGYWYSQKIADDFTLGSNYSVTGVNW